MHSLSSPDRPLLNRYLHLEGHELSVYAFENIYIWKNLFEIKWQVIDGCLCIFFQDKTGSFLYLPPLGREINPKVISESFGIMDKVNKNKQVSRIENIEEKSIPSYKKMGLDCSLKSHDYLYSRASLATLRGNKFKSKRAAFNYFVKHNTFEYLPFVRTDAPSCVALYKRWMKERAASGKDRVYRGMLEDNLNSFVTMLEGYRHLDLTGRVVKIKGKIKAFTFGFKLNLSTFCILYEITDFSFKGLAQFIFSAFCQEQEEYEYINVMDDSGLDNLKKVKLSYRPVKLASAYIATRNE
ncbi:MAG: phosphatidylglycerol lysyltransferase domain-containing protein [Candidatus Omnitrophota bacterium]